MGLSDFFRISAPSTWRVEPEKVRSRYRTLRNRTFWGVTLAYALYYVCRTVLGVVKQPLIDEGVFTAAELGIISSAFMFVYAVGKFSNGFIADYCNVRRFMAVGLAVSAALNLALGLSGVLKGTLAAGSFGLMAVFAALWGINGWVQSMGAPPCIISLSRWFPLSRRGTWYSVLSSAPYLGKALTMVLVGGLVAVAGWQWGFLAAAVCGFAGVAISLIFISDTPESKGLPPITELSGEEPVPADTAPTRKLHLQVLRLPAIWVIALSSAFIYITQYAVSNWGVLFLQKAKGFTLEGGTAIIGISEVFAIAGTILAGWLSDVLFKGSRGTPVIIAGAVSFMSLGLFLFAGGGWTANFIFISLYRMSIGVVYCIVAGLMAIDIVPRRATGAALGIVGIASYAAAGVQDLVSGFLIGSAASAAPSGAPSSALPDVAGASSGAIPGAASGAIPGASSGALPDVADTLPDVIGALPDVASTLPDVTGALPDVAGAIPDVTGAIPDVTGAMAPAALDFSAAAIFWAASCLISFILPVLGWKYLARK